MVAVNGLTLFCGCCKYHYYYFFLFSLFTRDIAMILCDPFAINTVSKSVIKQLQRLVNTELLPRVSFLSGLIITLSVRSSTTVTFLSKNN